MFPQDIGLYTGERTFTGTYHPDVEGVGEHVHRVPDEVDIGLLDVVQLLFVK